LAGGTVGAGAFFTAGADLAGAFFTGGAFFAAGALFVAGAFFAGGAALAGAFFTGAAFFLAGAALDGFVALPAFTGLLAVLAVLATLAGAAFPARLAGAAFFDVGLFDGFVAGFFTAVLPACFEDFPPTAPAAFFGAGLGGFFAADRLRAAVLVAVRPDAAFLGPAAFGGDAMWELPGGRRAAALPPASPGSAG
jgi:hypothetical protein